MGPGAYPLGTCGITADRTTVALFTHPSLSLLEEPGSRRTAGFALELLFKNSTILDASKDKTVNWKKFELHGNLILFFIWKYGWSFSFFYQTLALLQRC